jgi:hypothetical protein
MGLKGTRLATVGGIESNAMPNPETFQKKRSAGDSNNGWSKCVCSQGFFFEGE